MTSQSKLDTKEESTLIAALNFSVSLQSNSWMYSRLRGIKYSCLYLVTVLGKKGGWRSPILHSNIFSFIDFIALATSGGQSSLFFIIFPDISLSFILPATRLSTLSYTSFLV
jgi:hypothetical protein